MPATVPLTHNGYPGLPQRSRFYPEINVCLRFGFREIAHRCGTDAETFISDVLHDCFCHEARDHHGCWFHWRWLNHCINERLSNQCLRNKSDFPTASAHADAQSSMVLCLPTHSCPRRTCQNKQGTLSWEKPASLDILEFR